MSGIPVRAFSGCWEAESPATESLSVPGTQCPTGVLALTAAGVGVMFLFNNIMLFIVAWPADSRNYYPISQKGK